jgi:hypothetical protein
MLFRMKRCSHMLRYTRVKKLRLYNTFYFQVLFFYICFRVKRTPYKVKFNYSQLI